MSHEMSFSELMNISHRAEEQADHTYKPMWVLAAENNAKPKILRVRKSSNDRNFTGC